MSMQHIVIQCTFNAPIEIIFEQLTDHETFGKLIGANIARIQEGSDGNPNGLDSIRRIRVFPAPAFEEKVVAFEPNKRMEYVVSKGSPIKSHIGKMVFSESDGVTHLHYTIDFEPKIQLPLTGQLSSRQRMRTPK